MEPEPKHHHASDGYIMQSEGHGTQALKRFPNTLITLPKEPNSPQLTLKSSQFLALCLTNLALARVLHSSRQRFRLDLLHEPTLQPQHAMATACKGQIMRGNEGG